MLNFDPVHPQFFEPSAEWVAPLLLGHWLVRRSAEGVCGGPIVEVEAYLQNDPACHAFGGKTPRNRSMWQKPGTAYIYLIYGNHFCVNAVCCPEGTAEAVLIRAIEPAVGLEIMERNRPVKKARDLTNGPGKLCDALDIDRKLDGAKFCDRGSSLQLLVNPDYAKYRVEKGPVVATSRIGITKAADLPLRFYLENSPFVSRKVK